MTIERNIFHEISQKRLILDIGHFYKVCPEICLQGINKKYVSFQMTELTTTSDINEIDTNLKFSP